MNVIGFGTLFYKEVLRFSSVWLQTIFAPVITGLLFLLVFGYVLGARAQVFGGVSYVAFLIPGLMMMSVISGAAGGPETTSTFCKVFRVRTVVGWTSLNKSTWPVLIA